MTELENWGAPSKEHETLLKHDDYELKHTPLFPINTKELIRVTKTLFKSGLPTSIGFICGFASGIVCLRFTGKYGTPTELAGASLGFTWAAVFCVGILASINQGFNVLASQLFGAKNYRELGILFQRNICVLSIVVIPLLLSLCFADSILIGIGLDPEVSMNTGIYLKCAIPSVVALGIFECLKCYLIAQNCFYIQPIIQGSLAIVHIFWCYLFVDIFEMPVAGIAIAKSITDVTSAIVLWLCIKYGGFGKEAWIPWDRACLEKWWSYFKQAMTLGANLYVEWISLEVSLFVIGMLNNEYMLGAHGVAITVMSLFFMFPLGNSISMQAYIGNAMGEGSQHKAQKFMVAGLGLNMIMTIINIIIMVTFREAIAEIFTSDDQTKDILQNMIFIFSFAHFADTNTNHLSGVLRTVGNEWDVLVSFFVCYVLIGINCEWIFGVALGYGYQAIWISMTLGMYIMGSWAIRKLKNLDWEKEVAKIRKGVYVEMV